MAVCTVDPQRMYRLMRSGQAATIGSYLPSSRLR